MSMSVASMAAAGGLNLCALEFVQTRDQNRSRRTCFTDRKLRFPNLKFGIVSPIYNPQPESAANLNLSEFSRRRPIARKAQIQEDSKLTETEQVEQVPEKSNNGAGREQEHLQSAQGPSWIPAFPHILTAAGANFTFGYHIGIINGPLESIAQELKFGGNTLLEGFVVSIFLVGAFVGSISGGILADKIGRRRTFQLCAIPLIAGAILSATSQSVETMILGRLLVGVGIGVNTSLVPLYISEIAPTKFRGAMGSLCQIGTCSGIIASLLFGIPAETDPHWWRTMFWVAAIPGTLLIAGMQFTVESPRWLGKVGRWTEARSTIEKLWGVDQVEESMEELRSASNSEEEASWAELFSPRYLKVVGIGGALFALQQFAGINGVLYFSSSNFHDAGITNGIAASAVVGVFNMAGALVASSLMDTQGRKKMLIGSYSGMTIALAMMVSSLSIPMDKQFSHGLIVAGTLTYMFTFALGAGPVTAIVIPEISSTRIRAKALAVSLCVHWVCNFAIGLFFLELVQDFGLAAVYSSFGVVSILSIFFAKFFLFETKGRSLEEIELLLNPNREVR